MDDRGEEACPEEGVHQKPYQPVRWLPELGLQREYPAADSGTGQQGKVEIAYCVVMVEPKVCPRDAGAPHDQDDAEVIELVAEFVHLGAVVRQSVIDGREDEADYDARKIDANGETILEGEAVWKPRPEEKVGEEGQEEQGAKKMGPDVSCWASVGRFL